jgi:hypothetical protein
MGTRSLTFVYDESNRLVLNLYRQMDGYPSGHGVDLAEFLSRLRLVNGFTPKESIGTHANGMGCLAAQMVAHFKTSIGGFYIETPNSENFEDYNYHVYKDKVVVFSYDIKTPMFSGTWNDFREWAIEGDE